jgi:hypothetical protein
MKIEGQLDNDWDSEEFAQAYGVLSSVYPGPLCSLAKVSGRPSSFQFF